MFIDILLAIPIGIIYNMIVHKTGEIFNNDMTYIERLQKNLLIAFAGGVFGILCAYMIFGDNKKYRNKSLKYGLILGAGMLLCHSIMYNWTLMQNDTKFIIMIGMMAMLIWYTYYRLDKNKKSNESSENDLADILPATYISYERYDDDYLNDDEKENVINYA